MIISVVNHSGGRVSDADLLVVLRAINRQIAEDFAPYWHMSATLRLEGAERSQPDLDRLSELRGDAVLYLWNSPGEGDPLGYHELHHRGIPYGFVFLDVAEDAGDPWSVVFSHEALEMIVDPDVNLLARGPDPRDRRRKVYHWYEVCDAVQGLRYPIDGVQVANFVLPLYFTPQDEAGSRNHFLGDQAGQAILKSFGVLPGGYCGFFDPATGRMSTYFEPADEMAVRRFEARERAGSVRRGERYKHGDPCGQQQVELQAELAVLEATFECIAIEFASQPGTHTKRRRDALLRALIADYGLRDWMLSDRFAKGSEAACLMPPQGATLDVAQAWELVHRLREDRRIAWAEPLFLMPNPSAVPPAASLRRASSSGGGNTTAPADREWAQKATFAFEAWSFSDSVNASARGAGIVIGHPDTGTTRHLELGASIAHDRGYDFMGGDLDETDPLSADALIPNPGHGTATSSVMISPRGSQTADLVNFVSGVAPAATVVPYRVTTTVVLLSMSALAQSIFRAVDEGCHVISISLGGAWGSRALREALTYAESNGVIVVAAAGNNVGFVVVPARYDETIAVAASNNLKRPWSGSSRGRDVDLSAPGERVYVATASRSGASPHYSVIPGDGTSFATALVAGGAALWLAHHGRDTLIANYGKERLASVFKEVLVRHGVDTPQGWDQNRYGSGIIHFERLLKAPLPAVAPVRGMRDVHASGVPRTQNRLRDFEVLFEGTQPAILRQGLAAVLGTTERELDDRLRTIGDELEFHMIRDPRARARFASHLRRIESEQDTATAPATHRARDFAAVAELPPPLPLRGVLEAHASRRLLDVLVE